MEGKLICPKCGSRKFRPYEGIKAKTWTYYTFYCENGHLVKMSTRLENGEEIQEIILEEQNGQTP